MNKFITELSKKTNEIYKCTSPYKNIILKHYTNEEMVVHWYSKDGNIFEGTNTDGATEFQANIFYAHFSEEVQRESTDIFYISRKTVIVKDSGPDEIALEKDGNLVFRIGTPKAFGTTTKRTKRK